MKSWENVLFLLVFGRNSGIFLPLGEYAPGRIKMDILFENQSGKK